MEVLLSLTTVLLLVHLIGDVMFNKTYIFTCLTLVAFSGGGNAAESAYEDLNACTRKEQIKMTAKGAGMGALTGLGAALLSGNKDDMAKGAIIGAVGGGVAGFATAYYSAVETCIKKNPEWIPESKLELTKTYDQVKKEMKYNKRQGIVVQSKKIDMPAKVKAGDHFDINTTYWVMTPDKAETTVQIERKLFVVRDGAEMLVPFPENQRNKDPRVVEPGAYTEKVTVFTPSDFKPGDVLRVEVGVVAAEKKASTVSSSATII